MQDEQQVRAPKPMPQWIQAAWLLALLAVPVVLWILPSSQFDEGESLCPSVQLFDTECFGCGSTRAVQHLHHFEVDEALYYHSFAPVIYLVLVFLWCLWTYRTSARLGLLGVRRQEAVESKLREEAVRRAERKVAKRDQSTLNK